MATTDFFGPIRKQAQRALAALTKEIAKREAELAALMNHTELLRSTIAGGGGAGRRGRGRPTGARSLGAISGGGTRLNWDEVLKGLPKTFSVDDVMKQPGVAAKGRAQVYPALDRWMQAKKVKRVGKGEYEKR